MKRWVRNFFQYKGRVGRYSEYDPIFIEGDYIKLSPYCYIKVEWKDRNWWKKFKGMFT